MIKLKNIIIERLSDIVYHFTQMSYLIKMLENDEFLTSLAISKKSDEKLNKGKFFYFSTTRSKSQGYKIGDVKLVLDGAKLSHLYKGSSVDYWQHSKNPKDWGETQDYIRSLRDNEQEDRIVVDKDRIKNATKYILEIHIFFGNGSSKENLGHVASLCKEKNIPVYFYNDMTSWKFEKKSDRININPAKLDDMDNPPVTELTYQLYEILALVAHKNDKNYQAMIKEFRDIYNFKSELDEVMQRNDYKFSQYNHNISDYDLKSVDKTFETYLRSIDRTNREYSGKVVNMLVKDMKLNKIKNISEYIKFKVNS